MNSAAAAILTEEHRQRQRALRALVIRQLVALWPAFDIKNIDETWGRIEPAILVLVGQARLTSGAIAQAYYLAFRAAENVPGAAPPPTVLLDDWRVGGLVSLNVTGPITAKRLVLLNRPDAAAQTLVHLSGATSRLALDGGRQTIQSNVRSEKGRVGWARGTSGKCCAFCAMLASRGPVYRSEQTANFRAHDHCVCFPVPHFKSAQDWPSHAREFQKTWNEATQGLKGKEAFGAFRHVVEAA